MARWARSLNGKDGVASKTFYEVTKDMGDATVMVVTENMHDATVMACSHLRPHATISPSHISVRPARRGAYPNMDACGI